ncbi:MAG: tetratricopeptide repeat protein [Patescibacteria group bacterium]
MENLAIKAALTGNWKEAVRLNLLILKSDPKSIEALNRLGRSYFQLGLKTKADETYRKVLKLDKFNTIAIKNLELIKTSKIVRGGNHSAHTPPPVFLEEPGVTKTLSLIRPSEPKILSRMHPADPVVIAPRQHCIAVTTIDGQNLGRLPDDLAAKMLVFIRAGSEYTAWVRSVEPNNLKIFIKEVKRATKFKDTQPFPATEKLVYAAFTPPELVHTEKPDVSSTEDQDQPNILEPEELAEQSES